MKKEEMMGVEKVKISAKYIMKEDYLTDVIKAVGSFFTNEDDKTHDRLVVKLFDQLKHPIPMDIKNGKTSVFVIDFLVKRNFSSLKL
jgi:hypothetical protein